MRTVTPKAGNAVRTQLSFLSLIAIHVGHPLRLDKIKRETFLPAMVASFAKDLARIIREAPAGGVLAREFDAKVLSAVL